MSYVVIEIDMNYDFIENVKIKKIFNSKEECEEYIKSREKEFYKSFELKNKYIDNFVKTIRLPDLNGNSYKIWEEFVSKFGYTLPLEVVTSSIASFSQPLNPHFILKFLN